MNSRIRDKESDEMPSKRCRIFHGNNILNMETTSNSTPNLISSNILHRHGSRGPGESELSPWTDTDCFIRHQWDPRDLENITCIGHLQCKELGRYFAKILKKKISGSNPKVLWRCSKSERAQESGNDFIEGYFENANDNEEKISNPTPYNENADNYFRPWKTVKGFSEAIKLKMSTSKIWASKAEENRLFLEKIYHQVEATKITEKITKALWSTTYLYSAKECEDFWPQPGERQAITDLIPDEDDWRKITELACWVWEERFIRNEYIIKMGGKLLRDMIKQSLNPNYDICFYSGHDYTILSLLSILGMQNIKEPASFACYIIIELWDAPPPPHILSTTIITDDSSTSNSSSTTNQQLILPTSNYTSSRNTTESTTDDQRVYRIIFNPKPFLANEKESPLPVHQEHEVVLGVYTVQEMLDLVSIIDEVYADTTTTSSTTTTSTTTATISSTTTNITPITITKLASTNLDDISSTSTITTEQTSLETLSPPSTLSSSTENEGESPLQCEETTLVETSAEEEQINDKEEVEVDASLDLPLDFLS